MSFSADNLGEGARAATGLDGFGSPCHREGLERAVEALNTEAELSHRGKVMQHATISNALIQRLKIEDTYKKHREIDDEIAGGPASIIGLPRTGSTGCHCKSLNTFRFLGGVAITSPTANVLDQVQHRRPGTGIFALGRRLGHGRDLHLPSLVLSNSKCGPKGIRGATDFRERVGDERFADVPFSAHSLIR